jgi:hypothetical protein
MGENIGLHVNVNGWRLDQGASGGVSYKDSLIGSSYLPRVMCEDAAPEECISEDEEDEDEEDCPVIKLSAEEKKRIRSPWRQTLIVKVMGRRVGYMYLIKRLKTLWKIQTDLELVDLGNDFFLAKFANEVDKEYALYNGPWMIADHYLTVRTWHPNFDPYEAKIDKVAVWVRLPDLAMEYYDNSVLWIIGNKIGKTLKVDRATSIGMRGNYARICVEVDLTKPLLAKFKLRRRVRRIMYEGLHLICFQCGQYGHKQETCPYSKMKTHDDRDADTLSGRNTEQCPRTECPMADADPATRLEITENYGDWMIAQRRRRRQNRKGAVTEATEKLDEGRRYPVIQDINSDPTVTDTSQLRASRFTSLKNSFADGIIGGDLTVTTKESHGAGMMSNKGKMVVTNLDNGAKKKS